MLDKIKDSGNSCLSRHLEKTNAKREPTFQKQSVIFPPYHTSPCSFNLFLKTHLIPIMLNPLGLGTRSHTSFLENWLSSSWFRYKFPLTFMYVHTIVPFFNPTRTCHFNCHLMFICTYLSMSWTLRMSFVESDAFFWLIPSLHVLLPEFNTYV